MKKILLMATMFLMFGFAKAQSYYFLRNGDLMETRGSSTSTFDSGSILGFANGNYDGKSVVIYWNSKEAFICSTSSSGGWSSKSNFYCDCINNGQGINNISFVGNNTLIINCKDGRVRKKTPSSEGSN